MMQIYDSLFELKRNRYKHQLLWSVTVYLCRSISERVNTSNTKIVIKLFIFLSKRFHMIKAIIYCMCFCPYQDDSPVMRECVLSFSLIVHLKSRPVSHDHFLIRNSKVGRISNMFKFIRQGVFGRILVLKQS